MVRVAQHCDAVKTFHVPIRPTARGLGINPKKLGITVKQLEGKSAAELARTLRAAGARLYRLASEIEGDRS